MWVTKIIRLSTLLRLVQKTTETENQKSQETEQEQQTRNLNQEQRDQELQESMSLWDQESVGSVTGRCFLSSVFSDGTYIEHSLPLGQAATSILY